jgi:hypothetical protein
MFNYKRLYMAEQSGYDDWYRIMCSEDDGLSWSQVRNVFKLQFFTSEPEKYKNSMFTEPSDVNDLSLMPGWIASLEKEAEREHLAQLQWRTVDM